MKEKSWAYSWLIHPTYGSVVWSDQLYTRSHFHPHPSLLSNVAKKWKRGSFSELLPCSRSPSDTQQVSSPASGCVGRLWDLASRSPRSKRGSAPHQLTLQLAESVSTLPLCYWGRNDGKRGQMIALLSYYFFLGEYLCVKRHYGKFFIWEDEERVRKVTYRLLNTG